MRSWAASGKPVIALVPEFDDYLRPDEARQRFAAIPQAEVIGIKGAKHLWVGDAETVLNEIVKRVAPEALSAPHRVGRRGGLWGRVGVRRPYAGSVR